MLNWSSGMKIDVVNVHSPVPYIACKSIQSWFEHKIFSQMICLWFFCILRHLARILTNNVKLRRDRKHPRQCISKPWSTEREGSIYFLRERKKNKERSFKLCKLNSDTKNKKTHNTDKPGGSRHKISHHYMLLVQPK